MFLGGILVLVLALIALVYLIIKEDGTFVSIPGGSYTEGIIGQPINVNPILSKNQADGEISSLIYLPLYNLLQTWSVSPDGKTYTLELKDGLKWSDGEDLTSDDVIFTINTAEDYNSHSPFYGSWQGVSVERVSKIQIKLTLLNPNEFFIGNLKNLPVIPEHIYGSIPIENFSLSEYKLQPVGSGPYEFKDFSKRKDGFITSYHLIPNPYFSGDKPYIPDFYFRFFESPSDVYKALELHEINGYDSMWPIGFDTSSLKSYLTEKISMPDYYAVFFNQNTNPVLKDPNIREALSLGIDRSAIISQILGNEGSEVKSPVMGEDNSSSTYDPTSASALISQYKSKNKNSQITVTISVPDVDFLKKTADMIKNDWQSIGIDTVNVQVVDMNDPINSPLKTRDYDVLLFGNFLQNEEDLFPFWHSSQKMYPGLNLAGYQNQKADNLMEQIRGTSDETTRQTMLSALGSIIKNDNPAAFLFSLPYFYIHSNELRGFDLSNLKSPRDLFNNVEKWSIAEVRVIK